MNKISNIKGKLVVEIINKEAWMLIDEKYRKICSYRYNEKLLKYDIYWDKVIVFIISIKYCIS